MSGALPLGVAIVNHPCQSALQGSQKCQLTMLQERISAGLEVEPLKVKKRCLGTADGVQDFLACQAPAVDAGWQGKAGTGSSGALHFEIQKY